MASGTPAVAMRRGAVPELIVDGVTGFCVDGVDGMVDAVLETRHIDSQHCAAVTRDRFSPAAMAAGYLRAYDEVVTGTTAPLAGWQVVAHAQEVLSDPLAAVE